MGRYAVNGSIVGLLNTTLSSTGGTADSTVTSFCNSQYLLGASGTAGRTFWLRSFVAYNAAAELPLAIYDGTIATATVISPTTATGGYLKAVIICASGVTTVVDFPAPGLKFTTSAQVCRTATTTATAGFGPGTVGGAGYEE